MHLTASDASTGQDVKVYTMDGRQYSLPIKEGITSVGEIRAFVAHKENAPIEKVCRLLLIHFLEFLSRCNPAAAELYVSASIFLDCVSAQCLLIDNIAHGLLSMSLAVVYWH